MPMLNSINHRSIFHKKIKPPGVSGFFIDIKQMLA